LHLERIKARCPSAKPYSRATLRFWRLTYKQNFRGNGVATIERNQVRRGAVYGALYEISEKDMRTLDRFEGHPNVYQRYWITVETPIGKRRAIVYIMNDKFTCCAPNPKYLNTIMTGYKQWGLPLQKLVTEPSEQDYKQFGKPKPLKAIKPKPVVVSSPDEEDLRYLYEGEPPFYLM
jgi:gamma-glutamylcyclotransferase (GGCT)/AIG2-like uncharacterized protein YtfP